MTAFMLQSLAFHSPWRLKKRSRPHLALDDYPIHSTEKLRFADADRNGHVSHAVFALCCQSARLGLLCDPGRLPISGQARFVIASLERTFLGEMHWPRTVQIGTRVDHVGRSSVSTAQGLLVQERCVDVAQRSQNGQARPLWHRYNGEES